MAGQGILYTDIVFVCLLTTHIIIYIVLYGTKAKPLTGAINVITYTKYTNFRCEFKNS